MKEKKIIFVKTAERHAKNKHRKNGAFSPKREVQEIETKFRAIKYV